MEGELYDTYTLKLYCTVENCIFNTSTLKPKHGIFNTSKLRFKLLPIRTSNTTTLMLTQEIAHKLDYAE